MLFKKILITIFFLLLVGALSLFLTYKSSQSVKNVNEKLTFQNKLIIPPLLEPTVENGQKIFTLNLQKGTKEFFSSKKTSTWGINGDYLGPTLRMRTGDKVAMKVTNKLNEATTLHWHGMELPAAMDGGPHQQIEPGQTWTPSWDIKQQAATLWYHPHQMEVTGPQVYKGLAGMIIIDDDNSESLDLPDEYGVDDIPLIVQDRKFDTAGNFVYDHDHSRHIITTGMLGDTILVNGTYAPYVELPAKRIRLRLLNGSNARRYNFGFSDKRVFYQISTDGGFLEAPVKTDSIVLSPGERAEILVDLSSDKDSVTVMSSAVPGDENTFRAFMTGLIAGGTDENQQFKILEIRPQPLKQKLTASESIPQQLNTIVRPKTDNKTKTRLFKLDTTAIDGKQMKINRIDLTVYKGETEIWHIRNESPTYHPMHIHGLQFLILDRDGGKVPAQESGWKDTVIVKPEESVKLLIQFKNYADPNTAYMYHCHILEHEDMGMMGQLVVVEPGTPKKNIFLKNEYEPEENKMEH